MLSVRHHEVLSHLTTASVRLLELRTDVVRRPHGTSAAGREAQLVAAIDSQLAHIETQRAELLRAAHEPWHCGKCCTCAPTVRTAPDADQGAAPQDATGPQAS